MTKREKSCGLGFHGSTYVRFFDIHAYIEEKLGKPVSIHDLANNQVVIAEIKLAVKDEFLAICNADEEAPPPRPNISALADILFEVLDEFDVTDLREFSDLTLISAWCDMVETICDGTDREKELKAALKEWLATVLA